MKKLGLLIAAAMLLSAFAGCNKTEKDNIDNENIPAVDIENEDTNVDEKVDEEVDEKVDEKVDEEVDETIDEKEEEKSDETVDEPEIEPEKTVENEEEKKEENKEETEEKKDDADEETNEWENSFKIVADSARYFVITDPEEEVVLKATVVDNDGVSADFQWYRCDENGTTLKEYNYGNPLSMGDSLTVQGIPMEEANITRYYVVHALVGNTLKSLMFTVTLVPEVIETPEFVVVSADGIYEYSVYSPEETVTLSAKIESAGEQTADYQWYRCDEYGNPLKEYNYGNPLSMGKDLAVTDIPYEEMMIPRYYVCNAAIGNTVRSVIFSVTMYPMGIEIEEEVLEDFELVSADGNYEYVIRSSEQELVLAVTPLDTYGYLANFYDAEQKIYLLDYCWTRCDENGNTLETHTSPVSWGDSCTVTIPQEEMMIPRYYRANAIVGNLSKYVIFKVTLMPMGVE